MTFDHGGRQKQEADGAADGAAEARSRRAKAAIHSRASGKSIEVLDGRKRMGRGRSREHPQSRQSKKQRARSKKQEVEAQQEQQQINQGAKAPKDQEKIHSRVSGKIKWGVGRKGRRFVKAEAKSIHAAGRAGARSKKQEKEAQQEQQNQSRKQQAEARDQSKGEIEGSAGTTDDAGAAGARSGRR
jgi:hypothetical protein